MQKGPVLAERPLGSNLVPTNTGLPAFTVQEAVNSGSAVIPSAAGPGRYRRLLAAQVGQELTQISPSSDASNGGKEVGEGSNEMGGR